MGTKSEPAITATGISHAYGGHAVLDRVDLTVPSGSVFALLGPNGAGKTTMVRILSTLLRPDAGAARIAGHDLRREPELVRASISLTGQYAAVDELLTGEENLRMIGRLSHLDRATVRARTGELLERFDLVEARRRPVKTYSGGMRRRLDLAASLIAQRPVVFLDEPTTGLDPRSRQTVWKMVRDLVADGVTVLLTTQYLEEADQLAERVAVLDKGRIVAEGSVADLKRGMSGGRATFGFATAEDFAHAVAATPGVVQTDQANLSISVATDGTVTDLKRLLEQAERSGLTVADVALHRPTLDDVFLALTGEDPANAASRELAGAGANPTRTPRTRETSAAIRTDRGHQR